MKKEPTYKTIIIPTCKECGAYTNNAEPITTIEELVKLTLDKVPQYKGTRIPGPVLKAAIEVLQNELLKRDRAIHQLKSMFTEEELLVGGREQC